MALASRGPGTHLLKQRTRKSRPSLDSRGGITGGSFVDAMWNRADTCTHMEMSAMLLLTPPMRIHGCGKCCCSALLWLLLAQDEPFLHVSLAFMQTPLSCEWAIHQSTLT